MFRPTQNSELFWWRQVTSASGAQAQAALAEALGFFGCIVRTHSYGSRTVLPNTVNSATPGVIPFGQPVMTNRARVATVGVHSR